MKIFITGATGFVGGAVAQALVQKGHELMALARPGSNRAQLAHLPIEWVTGDVLEPAGWADKLPGVDGVVHAAGMLGQAGVPEEKYHQLHVEGTRQVCQAVQAAGVKRLLYVSSPGVLGPIAGAPADETTPLNPSNPYERSKAAAEQLVHHFVQQGCPAVIARPEFIYGVGDSHVLGLFKAVQKGLFFYVNGGRAFCHPTFIEDAVNGLSSCLEQGRIGEVYHICGPRPVTFKELGSTIAQALGVRPPWLSLPYGLAWVIAAGLETAGGAAGFKAPLTRTGVDFFSENRRFAIAKAATELSFYPQFDLASGVAKTVAWYKEQGWL